MRVLKYRGAVPFRRSGGGEGRKREGCARGEGHGARRCVHLPDLVTLSNSSDTLQVHNGS